VTDIGPIQLMAVGFGPGAKYEGGILAELERFDGKGLVRVLDLLFVGTDSETGELVALDYQGDSLGSLVGALLDFGFEGDDNDKRETVSVPPGQAMFGLTKEHLETLLRAAPSDLAVGILLIEHVWARDLKNAIRNAGGVPLAEGFLSQEALGGIAAELTETVRIIEELEHEDVGA
jgi:hypothetical protein